MDICVHNRAIDCFYRQKYNIVQEKHRFQNHRFDTLRTMHRQIIGCWIHHLLRYYYQTAKTSALYECSDGPAGQPADNPPNSDELGYCHHTVPKLTVHVYWQPSPPIGQGFGSDPDPVRIWQSGTVANDTLLLCVISVLVSVTKLQDMIICLYMCEGCMGHTKVLDSKSSWLMTNKVDIEFPVTANWESKI